MSTVAAYLKLKAPAPRTVPPPSNQTSSKLSLFHFVARSSRCRSASRRWNRCSVKSASPPSSTQSRRASLRTPRARCPDDRHPGRPPAQRGRDCITRLNAAAVITWSSAERWRLPSVSYVRSCGRCVYPASRPWDSPHWPRGSLRRRTREMLGAHPTSSYASPLA
jgi:hypothetical protein